MAGDWRSDTVTIEYDPENIEVETIQEAMIVFGYDSKLSSKA